jgi:hypothetical protein
LAVGPSVLAPFVVAVLLAALYLQGRRNEHLANRRWCFVMTREGAAEYERVAAWLGQREVTARSAYAAALALSGEARRSMLDACLGEVLETSPGLLACIGNMRRVAAQLEEIQPLPPIAAGSYRTRRLAWSVAAAAAVHHVLAGTGERFRFRLHVLRRGVLLCWRLLATERDRGTYAQPRLLDDAVADHQALSRDTLESFRALLASIAAVPVAEAAGISGPAWRR